MIGSGLGEFLAGNFDVKILRACELQSRGKIDGINVFRVKVSKGSLRAGAEGQIHQKYMRKHDGEIRKS